ncbi:protein jag [Thermodesulfobacterium hveragerdense]|uniref:Jag family protein n=1 Tax=Thermodesulfobacterium hveragerdense TaxID=53424 RepID=UPI0003F62D38|nr:Jag N-terminal domain-containing protein [Thermodesulfobacterium hveragerdense]
MVLEKELEGKSLDQLLEVACQELGCMPEDLELEILEVTSSSGLLGMPSKKIKIKAKLKPDKMLSERANKALTFLKDLFYYTDFQIETQTNLLKDKLQIEILLKGEDLKYLVQNGGEVLSALEFLTNKIVAKSLGVGPKIVLKPEGINLEREKRLVSAVKRALEKVKTTKEPQVIKVGSQREQRIVINLVKTEENIDATIEGEGKQKKVILQWSNSQ